MKRLSTIVLCSAFLLPLSEGNARDARVTQIPSGNAFQCMTCHNFSTGGSRNPFGQTVESDFLNPAGPFGVVDWGNELALFDSDGDGFTNGEELGDAEGAWLSGPVMPGYTVSNPGSDMSTPRMGATANVVVDLKDMGEHEGKSLWMRLVDVETGMEVTRTQRINISSEFKVGLMGMEAGKDYFVDFFVDENNNGTYEAPPADKAWRIAVTANGQDMTETFTNSDNYVDIMWGQVVSVDENGEVGSLTVESVYPNPVSDIATIDISSKAVGQLVVEVVDMYGNVVTTLFDGVMTESAKTLTWNISGRADIASGRYYVHVSMGNDIAVAPLTVNR